MVIPSLLLQRLCQKSKYRDLCAIWYLLYNFKNVKNTYGGVLPCNFSKCNSPPWVFLTFLKLYNGTKSREAALKRSSQSIGTTDWSIEIRRNAWVIALGENHSKRPKAPNVTSTIAKISTKVFYEMSNGAMLPTPWNS